MFKTAIKTLSLFRKVSSYNCNYNCNYIYNRIPLQNIEQPKLYYDAFNMCMLSAFVKDSVKNPNDSNEPTQPKIDDDCDYCTNFIKRERELRFVCQITGSEKREYNMDCTCKDKCIVEKSEIAIITHFL